MGFGMALMNNPQAYRVFSQLSPSQRQTVLDQTHAVSSKQEMQTLVDHLARQVEFS